MPLTLGRQWVVELYNCNPKMLERAETVEDVMVSAAKAANATIVNSVFHGFNPFGVSGMIVISESHLAIHTWPEHRYAAVDIFTCGETINTDQAIDCIVRKFGATKSHIYKIPRGRFNNSKRPIPIMGVFLEGTNKRQMFPGLFKAASSLYSMVFNLDYYVSSLWF